MLFKRLLKFFNELFQRIANNNDNKERRRKMTNAKKQDIIAKVSSFLNKLLDEEEIPVASSAEQPV